MTLRKKAVRGVFWTAVQNWGASLISGLVLLVLVHLLSVREFGLMALAMAFIAFMEIVLKQGFGQALVQKEEVEDRHCDAVFWTAIVIAIVLIAASLAAAGFLANLFEQEKLAPLLRWLGVSFLIRALSHTQEAILRRRMAFRSLALRTLVATLVGGTVGIGMALLGYGVWSLVGQNLATGAAGSVVLWASCDWKPSLRFSRRHFRELWSFGSFSMGVNVVNFFTLRADILLGGFYLGTEALGYYSVAYRLLQLITRVFTGTISAVAFPTFSRIQHDLSQMRNAFLTATQMTSLVAMPAFFGLAVLAPELVSVFLGEKWLASIPVVRILALYGILQAIFHFNGPVILACGKASWRFGLACLNAVVQVIAIMIAVRWGIVGVAAACLIRVALVSPLSLAATRKLIGIEFRTYLARFAAPLGASLGMVLAVLGAKHILADLTTLQNLLGVYIAGGVLVYSLFIFLLGRSLVSQAWELVRLALTFERKNVT